MKKIEVDSQTINNLGTFLREENEKLSEIVSKIFDVTIEYQDMLISDAGKLFQETMINEQKKMKDEISLSNQNIADKLIAVSKIYDETVEKIRKDIA